MENTTEHELKELRSKLIGKKIVNIGHDVMTFEDGSSLEFSASVFYPTDKEFIYTEGKK